MATIQKRKNKNRTISYRVMIRPSDGLPAMYKTFPTFEEAKDGCAFSAVDTFDFQAEEFYLKNGYKRVSELKNCWFGHSKFFLRKDLS